MNLLAVGVNYHRSPLELREQLAIPGRNLPAALSTLKTQYGLSEVVILSTCNRVEFYVTTEDLFTATAAVADFLTAHSRLAPTAVHAHLYRLVDERAVTHLFRVAAGLDSMVLGESEITAQLKHAYALAQAQGAAGPLLNRLFQKALHSAKIIRSQTRIAEGQASIGSIVATLTQCIFGASLPSCEVLLWGAGKAAEATVQHVRKLGVQRLWIVNRTQTKAEELAALCQGGWLSWEQALHHLRHVDIAIVCTQAPHYVIDPPDVEVARAARGARPLVLIDLAVPRNVDPQVARQPGVRLYNIDDLQTLAQTARARRHEELSHCELLIQEQVGYFLRWWKPIAYEEAFACPSGTASLLA